MPHSRVTFLVFLLIVAQPAVANTNFNGSWSCDLGSSASFTITLRQSGDRLSGRHLAISNNGDRIDFQPNEAGPSIEGKATPTGAQLSFTSAYSGTTGEATLFKVGKEYRWTIDEQSSGDHYFPQTCLLHKDK